MCNISCKIEVTEVTVARMQLTVKLLLFEFIQLLLCKANNEVCVCPEGNTQCQSSEKICCPEGQYRNKNSQCIQCKKDCLTVEGQIPVGCSPLSNSRCRCKTGTYLRHRYSDECMPSQPCQRNEKYLIQDDDTAPSCVTCPEGTESGGRYNATCKSNMQHTTPSQLNQTLANEQRDLTTSVLTPNHNESSISNTSGYATMEPIKSGPHINFGLPLGIGITIVAVIVITIVVYRYRHQFTKCTRQRCKPQAKEHELVRLNSVSSSNNPGEIFQPRNSNGMIENKAPQYLNSAILSSIDCLTQYRKNLLKYRVIRIAVVDSGADLTHPLLQKIKTRVIMRQNMFKCDDSIEDLCGHGTAILSIFAKYLENILDSVHFILIKAINDNGQLHLTAFESTLQFLEKIEVDVICLSAGFCELSTEEESKVSPLVSALKEKAVFISAASNLGCLALKGIAYPAKETIAVGGCDNMGNRSNFSPMGQELDFLAPAENIDVAARCMPGDYGSQSEKKVDGTSYANPYVCVVAALVLFQINYRFGDPVQRERYFHNLRNNRGMKKLLEHISTRDSHSITDGFGLIMPNKIFFDAKTFTEKVTSACHAPIPNI